MGNWNFRVVKTQDPMGDYYLVREIYYHDDGSLYAIAEEPAAVGGESIEELREVIAMILSCLDKPALAEDEVDFVGRPTLLKVIWRRARLKELSGPSG